jgi:hypothetical protein
MERAMTIPLWEYSVEVLDPEADGSEAIESQFDAMGEQGWELVSVTNNMGKDESWTIAFFKRPKPPKA